MNTKFLIRGIATVADIVIAGTALNSIYRRFASTPTDDNNDDDEDDAEDARDDDGSINFGCQ